MLSSHLTPGTVRGSGVAIVCFVPCINPTTRGSPPVRGAHVAPLCLWNASGPSQGAPAGPYRSLFISPSMFLDLRLVVTWPSRYGDGSSSATVWSWLHELFYLFSPQYSCNPELPRVMPLEAYLLLPSRWVLCRRCRSRDRFKTSIWKQLYKARGSRDSAHRGQQL